MNNKIAINSPNVYQPPLEEGQFFYNHKTDAAYLLARSGYGKFSLINLKDGGRWSDDTKNSMLEAFSGKRSEFTLITEPFTITPDTK